MDWRGLPQYAVNLSALVFGVATIIALTKMLQYLPGEYYFSFAGFLYYYDLAPAADVGAIREPANWLSLVFKLGIPVITGLLLGLFWQEDGINAAAPAGFAGAFLLSWPAIIEWEVIALPEVVHRRNQFLLLFAMYIGFFAYLTLAGSRVGLGLRRWMARHVGTALPDQIIIDWNKLVNELIKSAVLGALAFMVGYVSK